MTKIRTRLVFLCAGTALTLAAALVVATVTEPGTEEVTTHELHTTPVTDLSDDRKLVGLAHSVFVGEVLAQAGQTEDEFPETQFDVRVIEVIKGTVSGTVIVNQHGGFRREGKELVLSEGDHLVETGQTYVFVTRDYPEKGWHTLVPVHGNLKVNSAEHGKRLGQRFRAAHQNEVPFDA